MRHPTALLFSVARPFPQSRSQSQLPDREFSKEFGSNSAGEPINLAVCAGAQPTPTHFLIAPFDERRKPLSGADWFGVVWVVVNALRRSLLFECVCVILF